MNYQKKTVRDIDVKGKKVLLRCDFNVPQDKKTGEITSDKRIVAALPTIRYLLEHGAAVIACSHLGKPEPDYDKWVKKQTEKGRDPAGLTREAWEKAQKKLTLAPVAARLAELLGRLCSPVRFCCLRIPALKRAKQKTIRSLPKSWHLWQTSMCLTHSAPFTAPMLPLSAWPPICLPCPVS